MCVADCGRQRCKAGHSLLWGLVHIRAIHILLSVAVFCAFGLMFFKMSLKHTKRIKGYREAFRPIWHFFDLKSYVIMAVMMGGGIWLRASGLVPDVFIAVFYTGLGCALGLAGILFWVCFCVFSGFPAKNAECAEE